MHLGMSGTLRIVPEKTRPEKHDHFEIWLNSKLLLNSMILGVSVPFVGK